MHECVLIPEGVSDVAWLEALQTALELHQSWQDVGDGAPLFSTFVGVSSRTLLEASFRSVRPRHFLWDIGELQRRAQRRYVLGRSGPADGPGPGKLDRLIACDFDSSSPVVKDCGSGGRSIVLKG